MRTALDNHGYEGFYVNARTNTYLQLERPFLETINRANAYVESGASGIFVPGLTDYGEIKEITLKVNAPINVLSLPGLTNCNDLKELGVKRFSIGNALSDKIISCLTKNATLIMESQDTSFLYGD